MRGKYILGLFVLATIIATFIIVKGQKSEMKVSHETNETKLLGKFAPTFYRILDEAQSDGEDWDGEDKTEILLTMDGKEIAKAEPSFKKHLDIEGSARLDDGRVVNFAQKVNDEWRYSVVKNAPFGIGANGDALIPYRTIAVDPNVIALGTVLYIPELKGIKLPSGEIHDGYVFAHDTGQGILGNRIDVFVGFENDVENTFTNSRKIIDMRPSQVFKVDDATRDELNNKFRSQFER